jgi:two-component system OmpR family sensor kinase
MPHQPTGGEQPPSERPDDLLAMLAHELRRPLTTLLGALATLQRRGPAPSLPQQDTLLAIAHGQAGQLRRLLDQILAAAGLDQPHPATAQPSPVDAATLAQEAGVAARLAHPDRPITIRLAGPLPVGADPLAISRVLGNLLDNAAAHTPPGTPILLVAARRGHHAVLAVQDTGPGIPPAQRERVFERYARLDQPRGRPGAGLGLGLYVARRLARASGGDLRATDPPGGHGARLELRLPLATPPSSPCPGLAAHTHDPGPRTTDRPSSPRGSPPSRELVGHSVGGRGRRGRVVVGRDGAQGPVLAAYRPGW